MTTDLTLAPAATADASAAGPSIGALAPWFGAKRTLAPVIVEELGAHRSYWEPFCGSMAVLLAKPTCSSETVNDLHADLINLARVVRSPALGPALYRRLRRTLMAEALIDEAAARLAEAWAGADDAEAQPDVERAYWYFVQSWTGRNGVAGTRASNQHFCRRFTANGGSPSVRLASAVRSIPAWRRRLARVCILRMDGFEMLSRVEDAVGAAIYVDPPYLVKGARYLHDFDPADHARLAELLSRFRKARVVVSYYDHPRLDDLYPASAWTRRRYPVVKAMANVRQGERRTKVGEEVLLINGPSYAPADGAEETTLWHGERS